MPAPWNRHATNVPNCTAGKGGPGCEALLEGTLDLALSITRALNSAGRVPIFSNAASFTNPKGPGAPFWLDEARLLTKLEGTDYLLNYEYVRAEALASSGQLQNMLREGAHGVRVGMHVYLKNASEDVTPHLAAFLVLRRTGWYFFASTGWLDDDWAWHAPAYDNIAKCGKPTDPAPVGSPAPLAYTREYEHCTAHLDCTASDGDEQLRGEEEEGGAMPAAAPAWAAAGSCRAWIEGP